MEMMFFLFKYPLIMSRSENLGIAMSTLLCLESLFSLNFLFQLKFNNFLPLVFHTHNFFAQSEDTEGWMEEKSFPFYYLPNPMK